MGNKRIKIYFLKEAFTLNNIQKCLYTFSEFVEHALRLQAQSERRLSVKCINVLDIECDKSFILLSVPYLFQKLHSFFNFFFFHPSIAQKHFIFSFHIC